MNNNKEINRFKKTKNIEKDKSSERWQKIREDIQIDNIFTRRDQPSGLYREKNYNTDYKKYDNSFIRNSKPKRAVKKEFDLEKMCNDFPALPKSKK